ncbi:P-loop containing nucleoside triphosphate hydrolase protein [Catenaria anguillulae PL171]|uniref:p-loop containing nucleoside triphosphate hydrolase protein n=1 Tax=Catenaria anguillulae PL171 TaxID=765915 RepID=A0A1Y2GZ31_9FUNG|nr:P-loop containing nucleoside triphosphate hydrolase protein [Catenaria anguillulae PL171]
MVAKKHKSKRMTCKQKYKIERKIKEAGRKARKEAKKNPSLRPKKSKDPGIPNLWPFKAQLLEQIEESKAREEQKALEIKQRRAELAKQKKREAAAGVTASTSFTASAEPERTWQDGSHKHSQSAYYREFQKVMEKADVILQVLDARDPMGTRAKHIENMILESGGGKRDNVQEWLSYLRHEFPTIAFKASTQSQRRNLGQGNVRIEHATEAMLQSSESIGADALIKLLKNYARSLNIMTSITVGVIGYPNVGKSSLINSLKRAKVCGTGATPGLTRVVQEIHLDKNIKLLDCPGIVFSPERADASWKEKAAVMLRNCVRVEALEDPITPVELILTRASKPTLMMLYTIPAFDSVQEFLFHVAKTRGKLRKGGVPDAEAAARAVLNDWNMGKIPFYSVAPKRELGGKASIVDEFAKEIDMDADLAKLEQANSGEFVAMPSVSEAELAAMSAMSDDDMSMDDAMSGNDDAMSEDGDGSDSDDEDIVVPEVSAPKVTAALAKARKQAILTDEESLINPQLNQNRRKAAKQAKKQAAKQQARLAAISAGDVDMDLDNEGSAAGAGDDSYDFGQFAWEPVVSHERECGFVCQK